MGIGGGVGLGGVPWAGRVGGRVASLGGGWPGGVPRAGRTG